MGNANDKRLGNFVDGRETNNCDPSITGDRNGSAVYIGKGLDDTHAVNDSFYKAVAGAWTDRLSITAEDSQTKSQIRER
ncbi:hypothetical protein Huta_1067 [Halorhabdus utahensis DSM 12940]|uniref:Uncharacterized protein n=1 Tax=Halorhabdus utahensis (strain DSM 12940 / JCM 11049 / AX-2) TaxID=519442 RepID=C7NM42_HALUD|nr:hypothetical protein Huta_1067 [Halorhabdus utahensis DSM 12940]